MTDDVRLILDRSALLAFSVRGIDVGETIAEVLDEGGRFGIPVTVLASARCGVDGEQARRLDVLTANPDCLVLSVDAGDIDRITEWTRKARGGDRGVCAVAALDREGCYILTADPDAYGSDLEDLVIGV